MIDRFRLAAAAATLYLAAAGLPAHAQDAQFREVSAAAAVLYDGPSERARKLFIELESEQAAAKKLDEELTQLQIEQGTWATNTRVEQVAQKRLGMRQADAQSTVVITLEERQ